MRATNAAGTTALTATVYTATALLEGATPAPVTRTICYRGPYSETISPTTPTEIIEVYTGAVAPTPGTTPTFIHRGPNPVTIPVQASPTQPGSLWVRRNNDNNCPGAWVLHQILVEDSLQAPVSSDIIQCGGGPVTFTATHTSPATLMDFSEGSSPNQGVGTTVSAPPYTYTTTLPASGTVTVWIRSRTAQNCTSDWVRYTASSYSLDVAPSTQNQSRCGAGTLSFPIEFGLGTSQVQLYEGPLSPPLPSTQPTLIFTTSPTTHLVSLPNNSTRTIWIRGVGASNCPSPWVSYTASTFDSLPAPQVETVTRCGSGAVTWVAQGPNFGIVDFFSVGNQTPQSTTVPTSSISAPPYRYSGTLNAGDSLRIWMRNRSAQGCTSPWVLCRAYAYHQASAPISANQDRCGAGLVVLPISGSNFTTQVDVVYNTPTPPGPSTTPAQVITSLPGNISVLLTSGTTQTVWLRGNNANNCPSAWVPYQVSSQDSIPVPRATPVSICGTGMITLPVQLTAPATHAEFLLNPVTPPNANTVPSIIRASPPYQASYFLQARSQATIWVRASAGGSCKSAWVPFSLSSQGAQTAQINPFPTCDTLISLIGNTPTALETVRWTIVSGAGANLTTRNQASTLFSGQRGIPYVVRYTIYYQGCDSSSFTTQFTIENRTRITRFTYPSTFVCANNSAPSLIPQVMVQNPGTIFFRSRPGGLQLDPQTGLIRPVTSLPGLYTVTMYSSRPCGVDSLSLSFRVLLSPPTPTLQALDSLVARRCGPGIVTLQANGGSNDNFQWFASINSPFPLDQGPTFRFFATRDTAVFVGLRNGECESFRVRVPIKILSLPTVELPETLQVQVGNSVTLRPIGVGPSVISYQWSPSEGLSSPNMPTTQVSPTESGYYKLTVFNAQGCSASDSVWVEVDLTLFIPTGFSPNGDQTNDTWVIRGISRYPQASIKVFNRWGAEIYSSPSGYPQPWDGTQDGKALPSGSYYYIIELDGQTKRTGSVSLLR